MIARVVYFLFVTYAIMLFIRVMGSWVPQLQSTKFMRFIAFYTDPYLNLFRKIIPPIGGVLDLSPIVAFIILQFAQHLIISLFQ